VARGAPWRPGEDDQTRWSGVACPPQPHAQPRVPAQIPLRWFQQEPAPQGRTPHHEGHGPRSME